MNTLVSLYIDINLDTEDYNVLTSIIYNRYFIPVEYKIGAISQTMLFVIRFICEKRSHQT